MDRAGDGRGCGPGGCGARRHGLAAVGHRRAGGRLAAGLVHHAEKAGRRACRACDTRFDHGRARHTTPAPSAPVENTVPAPSGTTPPPSVQATEEPAGAGILAWRLDDMPALKVYFDSGSTTITPEFNDKAKDLVDYLTANSGAKAAISGFNDPTGDPVKNAELSKNRAQAVQAALVSAGVAADRLELRKPADTTGTAATNAASRRVEVTLFK